MPLNLQNISAPLRNRLRRSIRRYIKSGRISGTVASNTISLYHIPIRAVHDNRLIELLRNEPQGYRVLFSNEGEISLAADFYYSGSVLRFAHTMTGPALDDMVRSLNAIEERFRNDSDDRSVSFLEFFMAGQPYVAVYGLGDPEIFSYDDQGLRNIDVLQLSARLISIRDGRQPITA
jgi:hypothetical protein